MTQQPGQDERAFLKSIKAAASEADVGGMTLQDRWSMMLVSGISDKQWKEKLSELDKPTLPAFRTSIDVHFYAKATLGVTAVIEKCSLLVIEVRDGIRRVVYRANVRPDR